MENPRGSQKPTYSQRSHVAEHVSFTQSCSTWVSALWRQRTNSTGMALMSTSSALAVSLLVVFWRRGSHAANTWSMAVLVEGGHLGQGRMERDWSLLDAAVEEALTPVLGFNDKWVWGARSLTGGPCSHCGLSGLLRPRKLAEGQKITVVRQSHFLN